MQTYGFYYSAVQSVDDGFVIRQEKDIVQRINYQATKQKMRLFRTALDDALSGNNYPPLWDPGMFRSKRPERIKFIFKDGTRYELKEIWVLPDDGCDKYEKLSIGESDFLMNVDNQVIYNFLKNLNQAYNDIIAKETMPWLEWTLKHFYPTYIADRGNVEDLGAARNGLECLLEDQLGLDAGKIVECLHFLP